MSFLSHILSGDGYRSSSLSSRREQWPQEEAPHGAGRIAYPPAIDPPRQVDTTTDYHSVARLPRYRSGDDHFGSIYLRCDRTGRKMVSSRLDGARALQPQLIDDDIVDLHDQQRQPSMSSREEELLTVDKLLAAAALFPLKLIPCEVGAAHSSSHHRNTAFVH